jgi:LysR family transcriptional regulator for bpeEF and oprC
VDEIAAIRTFVRVVQSGSFSAVARASGIGQPAISKQVASLERHVGAQLLRRTSRTLNLTEAGQDFYETSLRLLEDMDCLMSRMGQGQTSPQGVVRLSVAPVFGRLYILRHLPEFFARFPHLTVDFVVTDRTMNLVEEGIDLALQNGAVSDPSYVARRIATTPVVTVATRSYLQKHGTPATPDALQGHHCVGYAPHGAPRAWRFRGKTGPISIHPAGNFRTNDAEEIRAAVLSGLGLAHTPAWLFAPEIASGAVQIVLREYELDPIPISVVYPPGRRLPTRVRVLIEFLAAVLPPGLQLVAPLDPPCVM